MAAKNKEDRRSQLGYGSSYRKGQEKDLKEENDIAAVLGGQVWKVKPDKEAQAANPCIWMQAGAVSFKGCNNYYDCTTCKYDLGMKKQVEKGKQVSWQDRMRKRADLDRVCRHSLSYRIGKRQCAYDYQCSTCDFDQFFEDVWNTKTKTVPFEIQQVKGFDMPSDYYFHNGHTWARIESGGHVRIGIDDFALKVLGEADGFDLPLMGKTLEADKAGWGLKRKKNQADVLSPINGVIMEVNSGIRENPKLANKEPYSDGWLFVVRTPDIKGAAKNLMADTDSFDWMNSEVNTLEKMIEDVAGPMAADGGFLKEDIFGNIPDLGWKNLTKTFLKT
ncbi:MAG: glycine cleavage system protein H [Deltaproteobacteria bacterium]|nr:glycine cleavage system protein H [Deltaproteobacteria bacterium]